jgi:GTP-binding protein EngB required for normal cell division
MNRTGTHRYELSDGVRRRLYATFVYIDELLDKVERRLAPGTLTRVFPRYVADATPVQAKVIRDYSARVRAAMLGALQRHQLPPETPNVSAVWAARASLRSAGIAAAELAARHMRGYGELDDELARDLNLTSTALVDLIDRMESYLARDARRERHESVQQVDAPGDGQQALAQIERVIIAHGLIGLRGKLEALIDRLESDSLEVAVFGRVNSGKSSLLNFILGQPLLPVGVTPITALPTRIVYGSPPQGIAWFVDAQTETFELGRLAEFTNEHQNPGNVRHVTRLQIGLPHPLLQGVTLVDTPGLGSLCAAGAAATLAYLPRCDVGIVLIDAASTLTADDVHVVAGRARARARPLVVLTKADLLGADDLVAAESWLQHELLSTTGLHLPVRSVSIRASAAGLSERWIESTLKPCLQDRRRLRQISLARKIESLRADAMAALERRLESIPRQGDAHAGQRAARDVLDNALLELDRLRAEHRASLPYPAAAAQRIIAQAAHNAAVIWRADFAPALDATAIVAASLDGAIAAAAAVAQQSIGSARAALANALGTAARQTPNVQIDADDLGRPAALPAFQAQSIVPAAVLARPALLPPVHAVLAFYVRRQFERMGLRASIAAVLERHGRTLDAWQTQALDALRRDFVAQCDRLAARLEATDNVAAAAALRADLERLRRLEHDATPREATLATA